MQQPEFSNKTFLIEEQTPKNLKFIYEEVKTTERLNAENYVKKKFESQGFKVIKTTQQSKFAERNGLQYVLSNSLKDIGKPDFYCIDNNGFEFFIEVKTGQDGLKGNQMKWIIDNPFCLVYVFYLNQIRNDKNGE